MMVPLVQSFGTLSRSHTAVNRGCIILAESSGSALKSSVFRLSLLLLFFKVFMAAMISCFSVWKISVHIQMGFRLNCGWGSVGDILKVL